MSEAKLTLIGFNSHMSYMNEDLFKNLIMPDGIDADMVKNNILFKGGEFEVLYSDPYMIQDMIKIWSHKWYRTFEKWINALNIKYEPLDNYNRFEDYTDTRKGSGSIDTTTSLDNKTVEGSTTKTDHEGSASDVSRHDEKGNDTTVFKGNKDTEHKVSAFDSSGYQEKDLDTTDENNTTDTERELRADDTYDHEEDSTETTKHDNTQTLESDGTAKTNTSDEFTFEHHAHMRGNIGVTTSQQMLKDELDIARFNLIDNITDIFLREFVIPVY